MARRFLRMAMRLMRTGEAYVPSELREGATFEELQTYYLQLWPKLLAKWVKSGAVHIAFDPANPLGQWRERIQDIYEIELPLPKKKLSRTKVPALALSATSASISASVSVTELFSTIALAA